MKRTSKNKYMVSGVFFSLILVLFLVISPTLSPFLDRAAMISAVFSMPEGSLAQLQQQLSEQNNPPPLPTAAPHIEPSKPQEVQATPTPSPTLDEDNEDLVSPEEPTQEQPKVPVDIPKKHRGTVINEDLSGYDTGNYYHRGSLWLRNYTDLTEKELDKILSTPTDIKSEFVSEPEVLIYHTHATESYNPTDDEIYDKRYNWRTTDNNNNMVAVGAVIANVLEENGVGVIHDTTQHDYPSYNGSYERSYDTVTKILAENPSIKVVLDIHRDAIEREGGVVVKPTTIIDGEKYAQVMIISNCDDGSGLIPKWRDNLRFASVFSAKIEENNENITRPILFSHRKYNQQLSTGSLLLEFGSHANTIEESKRTAQKVGEALVQVLTEY